MNQIAIIFVGSWLFKGSPKSKKKPANTNIILIIKTTAYYYTFKEIQNRIHREALWL